MRSFALLAALFVAILTSCNGGGGMSLDAYFQELEELTNEANLRNQDVTSDLEQASQSTDVSTRLVDVFARAIADSETLLQDWRSGLSDLDPPSEARESHNDLLDALDDRLQAFADVRADLDNVESDDEVVDWSTRLDDELPATAEAVQDACLDLQGIGNDNDIDVDLRCEESDAEDSSDSALAQAVDAEADDDPSLPGEYIDLPAIYGGAYGATARHVTRDVDYAHDCAVIDSGEEICNGDPPAGGPHWSGACAHSPADSPAFCGPAPGGIYQEPWQPETLVHNMEHGGVVLWYNTTDQDLIDELQTLAGERLTHGQLLVMAPYPNLPPETITLTAWSRRDVIPVSEYSLERVEEFIDAHERRFNPEDF